MPFPWKMTNCTRFTQLVADHLHSAKHGGSLFVETGFPTSLIDLFVKNRDRLKKSSSKRKRSKTFDPPSSLSSSVEMIPRHANISSDSFVSVPQFADPTKNGRTVGNVLTTTVESSDDAVVGGGVSDSDTQEGINVVESSGVLLKVLIMFILVVLAFGTKKLAFGVTLSAFFLFFLEYTGKRLSRFLKPNSDGQWMLKPLILNFRPFLTIKKDPLVCVVSDCSDWIRGHEMTDQITEIQRVEHNPNLIAHDEEIQILEESSDLSIGRKRRGYRGVETKKGVLAKEKNCEYDIPEFETQKPRRAKIKSKLKKLVPKKLRCSNKTSSGFKGEIFSPEIEDNVGIWEKGNDEDSRKGEELILKDKRSFSTASCNEEEFVDAICSSSELFKGNTEANVVVKEDKRMATRKGNLQYVILCIVVLVGLVDGRIYALVLTLFWCLMLKSVETLRRVITSPTMF